MTRRHISTRERARLFTLHGGRCHLCDMRIEAGQEWDISHEIPLAMGGADDDANRLLAHRRCHRLHTATVDAPRIAKTRRMKAAHVGAKARTSRPLPGSRSSPWKFKVGGGVVRRDEQ